MFLLGSLNDACLQTPLGGCSNLCPWHPYGKKKYLGFRGSREISRGWIPLPCLPGHTLGRGWLLGGGLAKGALLWRLAASSVTKTQLVKYQSVKNRGEGGRKEGKSLGRESTFPSERVSVATIPLMSVPARGLGEPCCRSLRYTCLP